MSLAISSVYSQYTLSRSNFNAAGGSVSAGNYALLSSFGHPIEGSEVTAGNYTLGSGFIRTLPDACQNIIYVDASYNSGTTGWQTTHFDDLDDGLANVCPGGTLNIGEFSEYIYAIGDLDFSGYNVIILDYDLELTNGDITGGFVQTPNSGTLSILKTNGDAKTFPLSNDGTSNFTIVIDPTNNPTLEIEVKLELASNAPPSDGLLNTTVWEIEGEAGLDATLTFTLPDSAINGGKLPENVVFRFWNGTRYEAISAENVTVVDNGTYYTVTITNVNQF
jgi:hypothetical protein